MTHSGPARITTRVFGQVGRVLVADALPQSSSLLAQCLRECGHTVFLASDDAGVMKILKDEAPEVALIDVDLPGVGGLSLCQRVKSGSRHTKVILLTSLQDLAPCVSAEAHDILIKPAPKELLNTRVRLALKYHRAVLQHEQVCANLEKQLQHSQKLEAIGLMAGGLAHDLNSIFMLINGRCERLMERLPAHDSLRQEVSFVSEAGERGVTLTRQLLAFSRKEVLKPQRLDLNSVVSNFERMLRRLLPRDIKLEIHLGSALDCVEADPAQIEQVIMNLAINARDAMPNGGALLIETKNVELDEAYARQHVAVQPGAYVCLAVSDTGCGMDAKTRARAFEPFFTTKELGKGTGLGLSTVYGIVTHSHGHVWVYSEIGTGTTFKVYLPRAGAAPPATSAASVLPLSRSRGSECILVVEDDEGARLLAAKALISAGYTVIPASNGSEALELAGRHRVDLVLTDVVLPGLDGRALVECLQRTQPAIKALYLSGYSLEALGQHGILDVKAVLLEKPFSGEALAAKVRQVLDTTTTTKTAD